MKKKLLVILTILVAFTLLAPVTPVEAALSEIEILRESFEEGDWLWSNWESTLWYRSSDDRHTTMPGSDPDQINGTYSAGARYDVTRGFEGPLTCLPLDASDAESLYIEFYFMTYGLENGDFEIYYWDGTDYVFQSDLTTYGAVFPIWVKYSDTISDPQYLISDFRIRFIATTDTSGENAWVDAVRVIKTVKVDSILTLYTVGKGTLTADPVGPYSDDTLVTLTATADTGWDFTGWGGALSGATNPTTLLVDDHKMVAAYFSSGAMIDVSLSDSSIDRGSTLTTRITGGTGEGEVMIQFERSGQLVWADQRNLAANGALNHPLKIPSTWIDGTYTVRVKDVDSGTVDSATFAIPVPPPTPPSNGGSTGGGGGGGGGFVPLPTTQKLLSSTPEEAAEMLEIFSARSVALKLATLDNETHVAYILGYFDPEYAADVLTKMDHALAASLLHTMTIETAVPVLLEIGEEGGDIISSMLDIDEETTALRIEAAVKSKIQGLNETERKNVLAKLGTALSEMNSTKLVDLLIYIAKLPETPSTVAYILEAMPLSGSLNVLDSWLSPQYSGSYSILGDILSYLSDSSIGDIYRGMTGEQRTLIYEYLTTTTITRLPAIGTFEVRGLHVIPEEIWEGDQVLISAVLTNVGIETDDYVIPLNINGEVETTFTGLLSTGNSTVLEYLTVFDNPGTYTVEIYEETTEFTVNEKIEPPVIEPANLIVTQIEITPSEVMTGERVSISATIENIGGETGNKSFELFIDSNSVESKSAMLEVDASTVLLYEVDAEYSEGEHEVMIGGETASFTVTSPPPKTPWLTIIVVLVIAVAVITYYMIRVRGQSQIY